MFGWKMKLCKMINISPSRIIQWMKQFVPDIYESAFKKQIGRRKYFCSCGKECTKKHRNKEPICKTCANIKKRKIQRPSKEELEMNLLKYSMVQLEKIYNTNRSNIRDWAVAYKLEYHKKILKKAKENKILFEKI